MHAGALRAQGLLYPATARPIRNRTNHGHLSLSIGRDHGFMPPPWYGENVATDDAYDALYAEVDAAPEQRVLVSSEEFVQLALRANAPAAIADLVNRLSRYDVRILFYVREPMSLLKSWFNQVNKGPVPTRNFPSFFHAVNGQFLAQRGIWQQFADGFGAENVVTLPYGKVGQDHVSCFLEAVGCTAPAVEEDKGLVNEAQPLQVLEARRIAKAGADRLRMTFSEVKDIATYRGRVQKISDEFDALMTQLDLPLRSKLSATAIFEHYATLLASLTKPNQLNQKEADNLRDMALKIEGVDLALAKALMQGAYNIRPTGPLIVRKLSEYSDAIGT